MQTSDQAQAEGDLRLDATVRIGIATGTISVMGSMMIILILLRSPKKLKSIYRRLVFSLSCMDIVHSFAYVAGGLLVPNDEGTWHSTNAIGNVTTCNIQGFMSYTGLMGSLLYSCSLSIYFLLFIVYSKNENAIQKSIEPFFHAFSILIPLGLGIFLMATNYFNGGGFVCWIAAYPSDCLWNESINCTRGEDAIWYRNYFLYYPIAFISSIVFACMIRLLCSIRSQHKKMTKYGSNEILANINRKRQSVQSTSTINAKITHRSSMVKTKPSKKSQNEMKQTSIQAILYILAIVLSMIFPSLIKLSFMTEKNQFVIYEFQNFFLPLLGFCNFFIFIRPRVVITMQATPDLSLLKAFIVAIISKEIKPPQERRSARASIQIKRRSLIGVQLEIDAKNTTKAIQDEEEGGGEGEEREGEKGEKGQDKENENENEESKKEIVAYQRSLHGRENNTSPTNIGLNQKRNEGEEGEEDNNNNYHDKNEESKEEIVAYQCDIHERDNNTPLTSIGLNQMRNEGESEEKKDGNNYHDENEESKEEIVTYQSSLYVTENNTPPTNWSKSDEQ